MRQVYILNRPFTVKRRIMKRKFLNQIIAVGATAAMVAGLAGCGTGSGDGGQNPDNPGAGTETGNTENNGGGTTTDPVEDDSPYEVITDANGNPIDLGGVEVVIRDWWSNNELPSNRKLVSITSIGARRPTTSQLETKLFQTGAELLRISPTT